MTTMANLCLRKSSQKIENLDLLKLCSHLVLMQMEIIDGDGGDFLFIIQKRLMEIVNALRKSQNAQSCAKKRKNKVNAKNCRHHHSQMDACIFERFLIDSVPFVR
jgi:hypothetical protein